MTHFTVLVATTDPSRLEEIMAPWDENKEVGSYRRYEEGEPGDHWAVDSLRKAGRLNENDRPPTWARLVRAYNEEYPSEDADSLHLAEDGRAYTMTTYNPESKWDWYQVGGRWAGHFRFHADRAAAVIRKDGDRCDGGPLYALDLERMREEDATGARVRYGTWRKLTEGQPPAVSWGAFTERARAGEISWDQARKDYHSQPLIKAIEGTELYEPFGEDVVQEFNCTEEVYVERARASAVPGFALVTTDGRWMAPGEMGWWAATDATQSSRIGYLEAANAYIGSLDEATWLILLDCHI